MKQVLKGFYGHDILLVIEIVLDAAACHSAWGKSQPLRIAHATSQMHLGSARTMFLDYGPVSRLEQKVVGSRFMMQILEYGRISNARHFTLADRRANPHHHFALSV